MFIYSESKSYEIYYSFSSNGSNYLRRLGNVSGVFDMIIIYAKWF